MTQLDYVKGVPGVPGKRMAIGMLYFSRRIAA
jgi:hypothetical protein